MTGVLLIERRHGARIECWVSPRLAACVRQGPAADLSELELLLGTILVVEGAPADVAAALWGMSAPARARSTDRAHPRPGVRDDDTGRHT